MATAKIDMSQMGSKKKPAAPAKDPKAALKLVGAVVCLAAAGLLILNTFDVIDLFGSRPPAKMSVEEQKDQEIQKQEHQKLMQQQQQMIQQLPPAQRPVPAGA